MMCNTRTASSAFSSNAQNSPIQPPFKKSWVFLESVSHAIEKVKSTIAQIRDSQVFVSLLDDCFRFGIDLSHSFEVLLRLCSERVEKEKESGSEWRRCV